MAGTFYIAQTDGSEKTYLDVDPIKYRVSRPRRQSDHATDGGVRVWQDFGVFQADREMDVQTEWMSEATLRLWQDKFDVQAHTWLIHDHWGDEFHVICREIRPERRRGTPATYEVEMRFGVVKQSKKVLTGDDAGQGGEAAEVIVV